MPADDAHGAAVSATAAALKRHGSRSATAQRLLRLQFERGSPQVAIEALAQALLFEGIAGQRIPRPAGTRTKDLADRAEEAIITEVANYHEQGGVLLAKNLVEPIQLVAECAKQWLAAFEPTLVSEIDLAAEKTKEEINYRLALVAQLVGLELLNASGKLEAVGLGMSIADRPEALSYLESLASDPFDVTFTLQDIEGFCMKLSKRMYDTFQLTEEAAHAALHGELPYGDD